MRNQLNHNDQPYLNKRIKRQEEVIHDPGGDNLRFQQEEILIRTATGDFESITTFNSYILSDGQKVNSHLEITGKCVECNRFVTQHSARYCLCGKTLCLSCSKFWKPEYRYLCADCYKKEKRKRFWAKMLYVIIRPFIRKY
jgi:hypothetical protein